MALLLLSPVAIALLSCNLASPLDALPPLHMLAGCHIGLVVIASSLLMPPPLKAPARCPRRLSMHNPLVCPGWLLRHFATATASPCAGLLSPCLSSRHPLVFPAWFSRHPSSRHHLSTQALHVQRRQSLLLIVIIVPPLCRRPPRWSQTCPPIDGWLLCPLSPHLFPVNFDVTPSLPPSNSPIQSPPKLSRAVNLFR
jgi:hypothetical protein